MSKIVKRKITVQLHPSETSPSRLSVFQRLGNKKTINHPSAAAAELPASIKVTAILAPSPTPPPASGPSSRAPKQTSSSSTMKHHSSKSGGASSSSHHHHRLDDADPDSLELKRAELKKELEMQLKMESAARKTKAGVAGGSRAVPDASRKRKTVTRRSSSSSSSSSSGSDSSSDSSSSDSTKGGGRRSGNKVRKNVKTKRHQSSSSSEDEDPRRKAKATSSSAAAAAALKAKRVCHKKLEAAGKLKSHHSKKSLEKPHSVVQPRKRSPSPSQIVVRKHQRPSSPGAKPATKAASKAYPDPALQKHHRLKEPVPSMSSSHHRDKEREFQLREREREQQQQHLRSRDRVRSRSPVKQPMRMKSRSPGGKRVSRTRDLKQRSPVSGRRPPSKSRTGTSMVGGVRRGDRTPERIIIKKDVSGGKRHEGSREREHRREREREREAAAREKERQELIRAQERTRERDRMERDRLRVKVMDSRERDVAKSDRLLPRPAERAMALAAARDRSRDKSEERGVHDVHHRPRSVSHTRSGRGDPGGRMVDGYGDGRYDRLDDRYEMHRRLDKERSSAGLIRDDRSDRGDREREYMMARRREDSRGRIIEESLGHDPYSVREKHRGTMERDRSMEREREREREQRSVYGSERDRERMPGGDHGRYEEHLARDDRRMDRGGGSDRGHDYGRPSSRGGYIDDARGAPHRSLLERGPSDRDGGWHRSGGDMDAAGGIRGDDRGSGHHMFDRHPGREWERQEMAGMRQPSAGRVETGYGMEGGGRPEWSVAADRPWDDRGMERDRLPVPERGGGGGHHGGDRGSWQHSERDVEKWDGPDEYGSAEYHRGQNPEKMHHDVDGGGHSMGARNGPGNRRWPNWRGGRGGGGGAGRGGAVVGTHGEVSTNLFRRQNVMQDSFQDHQPEHHFRHHAGAGVHQAARHHNAFAASNVRPLLSLPPLKPPIMDDDVPSMMSPSLLQVRKPPPVALLNPVVAQAVAPAADSPKDESAAVVASSTNPPTDAKEPIETEASSTADVVAEPSASVPKEPSGDASDQDDEEGDVLSEISDDADEILNRQEEEAAAAALKVASAPPPVSLKPALLPTPAFKVGEYPRMHVHPTYAQTSMMGQPFDEPPLHHMHQPPHQNQHLIPASKPLLAPSSSSSAPTTNDGLNDSKDDDLDLDFEEISDGELEEEARIRGLGDALGVDWASLVNEAKAKHTVEQHEKFPSAKLRWQPHRILLDVGVSFRMAGKEFASNVLNAAHRQLKADEAEARRQEAEKLKQQKSAAAAAAAATADESGGVQIKKEILDEDDEMGEQPSVEPAEPEDDAELLIHPIACVQVASRTNAEARKNLVFGMTGPYSRALCSHRDIQMRRQLCGLPVKRCAPVDSVVGPGGADYAVIARQLFEKALGKV